jgi:streptogramin lyase
MTVGAAVRPGGVSGADPNQLNTPVQATFLPNSHILITDQGNERVIEVTPRHRIVWQYGTTGAAKQHAMSTLRQRGAIALQAQSPASVLSRPGRARRRWTRRLLLAEALVVSTLMVGPRAQATSGTITQYPVPGTCICEGIATGSDGALWFTEFYDQVVGRMTT